MSVSTSYWLDIVDHTRPWVGISSATSSHEERLTSLVADFMASDVLGKGRSNCKGRTFGMSTHQPVRPRKVDDVDGELLPSPRLW